MSDVKGEVGGAEDPCEGIGSQFLKDVEQFLLRSLHFDLVEVNVKQILDDTNTDTKVVVLKNEDGSETLPIWVGASEGQAIRLAIGPSETLDFRKLSGAEWLRLLASELIMSSLVGWCATCKREMRKYESPCADCGIVPVMFDDAFWIRIGARIKKAIRKDRQLLAVVKAEREDLYGVERPPLFPHQLDWLDTLWKNAARPASRPFSPKRHYQLTNWLSGIPFPVGDVANLIMTDETIDSPHRLRKRSVMNYSRQFLDQLRNGFLSLFGAQGVDQAEWWRTFKWVTRQRLEPLARLRGERPRMRKQKSSSLPKIQPSAT